MLRRSARRWRTTRLHQRTSRVTPSQRRRYRAGDKRLDIEIVDTSLVPMMRAGFAMAQMVKKDSTEGVQRGTTVDGQPGVLEWRKRRQRGKMR